jgi:hypothetical protein
MDEAARSAALERLNTFVGEHALIPGPAPAV